LREAKVSFGVLQSIASVSLTRCAIERGYDFVIFDRADDELTDAGLKECLEVIAASHVCAIVRLSAPSLQAVPRYLDQGAHGILMPHVRTAAEVKSLVEVAMSASERRSSAPLLLALIETAEAIENIDGIAGTEGLDGLVIGPNDLAKALGADFFCQRYRSAFVEVERAARLHQLLLGSRPHPGFPLERLSAGGHSFILLTSDRSVLAAGYDHHLQVAQSGWHANGDK
jgi:4-hydroxy-2-oxoheptanedioate aldolase